MESAPPLTQIVVELALGNPRDRVRGVRLAIVSAIAWDLRHVALVLGAGLADENLPLASLLPASPDLFVGFHLCAAFHIAATFLHGTWVRV